MGDLRGKIPVSRSRMTGWSRARPRMGWTSSRSTRPPMPCS